MTTRVGIIGAGYIAEHHARALAAVSEAKLAAVCDVDRNRAEALARAWGAPAAYDDPGRMLAEGRIDVVHLLVPPDLHAPLARQVISAEKHLLIEKPMCATAAECQEITDLAHRRGVCVGIGHNFLFADIYERLRQDVRSGRLGRVEQVTILWNRELPQASHGPFDAWMLRDPKHIALEIGSHCVAYLLDLLGEPDELKAAADRRIELPTGTPFYRRWRVQSRHASALADIHIELGPTFERQQIHVRGTLGTATLDQVANTYLLDRGVPGEMDIARCVRSRRAARALRRDSAKTLKHYVLGKLKLSKRSNPFGDSITESVRAFHRALREGQAIDTRQAARLSTSVVQWAERAANQTEAATRKPSLKPRNANARRALAPRILVVGANGFIGRWLVKKLAAAGHPVRAMVRNPSSAVFDASPDLVEVVQGDARSEADLRRCLAGVDCVYHLAKSNSKTLEEYVRNDVEPTRLLGRLCVELGVKRLIYAGTTDSLDRASAATVTDAAPIDRRIRRRNNYARAKALAEEALSELAQESGLPLVICRPAMVIGRGASPCHWGLGKWEGLGVCELWGRGEHPVPLVLVSDVADALVAMLDAPGIEGQAFNLSSPPLLSARDYLREIEQYTGYELQVLSSSPWRLYLFDLLKWIVKVSVRHPDRGRVPSLHDWRCREQHAQFASDRARSLLGWHPTDQLDKFKSEGIHEPLSELLR